MSLIQSALESIILNNDVSLVVVTAVAYDYILNFSREVSNFSTLRLFCGSQSTKCKPWTSVSTIFVIVRYIGLCWIMILSLSMFNDHK
ncbi:hypothetical protein L210DRAFT_2064084 [Boletus edulis BED1]|uniref:DUF6533 domain-containing protein n=1 Tax=Boletus edulis BED1 TaxID=1328754 RepID=A0AAD4BEV4_BOLED|nr:hypothetical protein L210DRAFT_2100037 [Boletus edulis BED1]KAF8452908.1 hypothetical protein L210DRAFT_2064084 [Boletus edulis BED1]